MGSTTQIISFPGLGIGEIALNRVAFTLFGHPIYWYGIIIAAAFILGIAYVLGRAKTFGLDSDHVIDVLIVTVIGSIVGARLYYVIFAWDQYKDDLAGIFKIWEGGIAIYGGILAGVAVGWFACRWRKVRFLPMADATVGGVILGQAIGRWGNFINVEAFGGNTTLPWGMAGAPIQNYLAYHQAALQQQGMQIDPMAPVHPTFFYESVWCLLGFLFIAWYTRRRKFDGEVSLIYLAWYGFGRMFIEGLRTDSLMWGDVRVSQWLAVILVLASLLILLYMRSKLRYSSEGVRLYVDTEESRAQLIAARNARGASKKRDSSSIEALPADTDSGVPTESAPPAQPPEDEKNG